MTVGFYLEVHGWNYQFGVIFVHPLTQCFVFLDSQTIEGPLCVLFVGPCHFLSLFANVFTLSTDPR